MNKAYMILKYPRSKMAKVVLINLKDFSHNEIEIELTNKLLPIATPLISSLRGLVKDNNYIVISKGILGGRNGVGLSDAVISTISPQSGGIIESKIQGKLANSIYSLGIDAIVLINKAKSLTGVEIFNRGFLDFSFPSARKMKGFSVWHTIDSVISDESLSTLAIGKSGEKQLMSASVVCDYGFATSQGGIGAVFGRMNIKYVSLLGIRNINVESVIKNITESYSKAIQNNPLTKSEYDAPGFGLWANKSLTGYMAGNNFGVNLPSVVEKFNPESFLPHLKDLGNASCPGCPQQCLKSYLVSNGPVDGGRQHQLSISALLSQYGEGKTEDLIEFNAYCHEIGVEHLYVVALLIQQKIKSKKSIKKRVNKVSRKKLITDFNQIKGMAMPPWDPRGNQGLYLAMALNPSGPRYDVIEHDIDFDPNWVWRRHVEYGEEYGIPKGGIALGTLEKDREQSITELWLLWSALDALGVCIYAAPPTRELRSQDILEMVRSQIAKSITKEDLYDLGLMRLAIQRDLNHQLGLGPDKDVLPINFFENPINAPGELLHGAVIDRSKFNRMRSAIISRLGWMETGGVERSSLIWQRCEKEIEAVTIRIKQLCE
jgi:aldehyde:ferredoxin oxidoreductase